jgi:hypothetical protein
MKILAVDSMKPNKFRRHLETVDAECAGKRQNFTMEN